MDLQKAGSMPEDIGRRWQNAGQLAEACLKFRQVRVMLPSLVAMAGSWPKGFGFWTDFPSVETHCRKARKRLVTELRHGVQCCTQHMRQLPHPHVLLVSAFFARALQLCKPSEECEAVSECPVLEFMSTITLED